MTIQNSNALKENETGNLKAIYACTSQPKLRRLGCKYPGKLKVCITITCGAKFENSKLNFKKTLTKECAPKS